MGRIKKIATERHTATLSPFVEKFVKQSVEVALHQLPQELASFPQHWPFPRGDLYHWIPLLDRFDHILELFNKEYELKDGPQTQPFERRLLQKGDAEEGMPYPAGGANAQELDSAYSEEGDRELVESIVHFTRVLHEHCGNRSLYASSGHISDLLNTTSLSLLRLSLKLALRLAQRYQVAKYKSSGHGTSMLMTNHYNFNLENLQKIAMPFPKPAAPIVGQAVVTPGKGKEKASQASGFNPADLVTIAKAPQALLTKGDLGSVTINYYDQSAPAPAKVAPAPLPSEASPNTPTPVRRTSALGPSRDRPSAADRSASTNDVTTPGKSHDLEQTSNAPKVFTITSANVESTPAWALLRETLPKIPPELRYDLLNRIRIAKAFTSSDMPTPQLLEVRLLAIANLSYALSESKFQEKIGIPDSEEPRRFHLAQQLCDLLQPAASGQQSLSLETETTVLNTIEAILRSRHKMTEVVDALSITVNHGVLYYELRKVIATLHGEPHVDPEHELRELEWREATFDLVHNLQIQQAQHRVGERLVSAGIMTILIEVLSLRTTRAIRFQERVLQFFASFMHNLSTAMTSFAGDHGFDVIADLVQHLVESAVQSVKTGNALPAEYKSRVVDYNIPFYLQTTLRQLFKFIVQMFDNNAGTHDRLLRNLVDTPQLLTSLKTVIQDEHTFGSNCWTGAVNILSSFIHNEPTSYQVVGEAGLPRALLEALVGEKLPEELPAEPVLTDEDLPGEVKFNEDGEAECPAVNGILPVEQTMLDIPAAFGAICLNESGMQLFQASKVLVRYFDIFVSPPHVKALTDDDVPGNNAAFGIGSAFDELARHQPRLKTQIVRIVFAMAKRVAALTRQIARHKANGAKLWRRKTPSEPDVDIDGGVRAIAGLGMTDSNSEVAHGRVGAAFAHDALAEDQQALRFVTACSKFLEGFCHNTGMCAAFCEMGGAEVVMDLVTSPSHPVELPTFNAYKSLVNLLKLMCDAKPHLVLPSILRRLQNAGEGVGPLAEVWKRPEGLFKSFVDISSAEAAGTSLIGDGTTMLKSLSHVQILSDLMSKILAPPVYTSRHATQTNALFATLNFTDVYLQLVDDLTRLRATCLWENLRLITNETQEFKDKTDPKTHSLRRLDANGRVEISSNSFSQDNAARANEQPKEVTEEAFKIRNVKSLRFVLEETISSVSRFIRNLGQGLLSRRGVDPSVKQHALVVAERIAKSMIWELDYRRFTIEDETTEIKYLAALLGPIPTTMIKSAFGIGGEPKEALTLVMREFYYAGGFGKLNELLKRFGDILAQQPATDERHTDTRLKAASYGLNAILEFYQQVVRHKTIVESSQTGTMKSGLDSSFKPGQFVIELRDTILPAVTQLWYSNAIETMGDVCVKKIIDIMRVTLKAEGEEEAYRSHDKKMRRVSHPTANFSLTNNQHEDTLRRGGISGVLAREAIYRCNNTAVTASEYARLRMLVPRVPRFQIPEGETAVEEQSHSRNMGMQPRSPVERSADMSDAPSPDPSLTRAEASGEVRSHADPAGVTATAESIDDENEEDDDDDEDEEETGRYSSLTGMLQNFTDRDLAALVGEQAASNVLQIANRLAASEKQGSSTASTEDAKLVPYVYVDNLENMRKELRDTLLDRCLEVLSAVPGVTFELCDLIQAAVPKGSESAASPRAEIGTTLVSSLMSLQGDESGIKIAAYAHLVALILQDRDFFDSTLDELKEYLVNFVDWVKAGAEGRVEDAPWLEMLLLILERMLAEDEQPPEIRWTPPPADDPMKTMPEPELPEPVVSDEARTDLFNALVDVLPKIGKNASLALSVSRIMVILTRRRDLAARLAEKQNLGRLFLMIRQLPGSSSDEKLRGCFMLVLRHLIEDETVVRQIMMSEVRAYLESNRVVTRGVDSTAYTRALYHLVLRDPNMFVDVTKELVEVLRYNGRPEQAQVLALKKEKLVESAQQKEADSTGDVEGVKASVEGAAGEESKPAEPKAPLVESTDGVVSFLLRELSNWRDVEDTARPSTAAAEAPKPNDEAPISPDVNMTDDSATPAPNGTPATPPTPSSSEKPVFKPEEHANFIYRCFLLQCLSELMQSYNRSKIEFINFSRKPESQQTPSKPRAGTLNYLLNNLVPVGTLEHRDDIVHRKKIVTSHWATEVIAGLCTKTTEKKLRHSRGVEAAAEEDADLAFVRRFVLEHALRSFKEATVSTETLDQRYARLLATGELFNRLLNKSERDAVPSDPTHKQQVGKLMYEKGYITALTAAIAELDLNFPNAKRAVKYILNPLKQLTDLGVELSQTSDSSSSGPGTSTEEDELSSATSVSDEEEEEREQTPDLLRNTTLGMLESSADHDEESSDDDDEEDEEMYDDDEVYDEMDEMDYDEGEPAEHGDVVSDEDEDPEMGPIEGMPGDVDMDVEIVMDGEGDEDDEDEDEDDEDDEDEEDFHEHLDEITGDDENASIADDIDGDEDDWEEDDGDDFEDAPGDGGSPHGGPLEHIAHVLGADGSDEQDEHEPAHLVRVDMGDGPEDYFEDEMAPEEEDEDDEEIEYDQEVAYEPELEGLLHNLRRTTAHIDDVTRHVQSGLDWIQVNVNAAAEDEDDDQEIGWDFDAPPPPTIVRAGHHHHHGGFRGAPPTFFDMRGEVHRPYTGMRSHRAAESSGRGEEDGANPLLQRGASMSYDREREDPADLVGRYSRIVSRLPNAGFPPIDLIQDLVAHVGGANGHGNTINVNLGDLGNLRTGLRNVFQIRGGPQNGAALIDIDPSRPWQEQMGGRFGDWTGRGGFGDSGRSGLTDETRAVNFMLAGTTVRWQEEARMIFGRLFADKAQRIVNDILRALVPAAMKAKLEHDRAERERIIAEEKAREEERKKEEAERAEREAQEKKEREEREERERQEREEQARLQAEQQQGNQAPESSMEGVESAEGDSQAEAPAASAEPEVEPVEQVFTTIRGRQVNITSLGIDRDFLDAIPEDMREEVIMAQVQEQRTQAAQNGEPPTEINREFLEALPRDIQQELLRSEASDRRRRERAEAQRQAAQAGNAQPARHTQPEEMDNADFMAMLDPALRQAILMDADENTLAVLPAEAQAEARALISDRLPARMAGSMPAGIIRRGDGLAVVDPNGARQAAGGRGASNQRRPIAQMLDKAGVATLLRLMFVSLPHKAKSSLHSILSDVCKNTQNRAEVISILLSILQDGTADVGAVERSFAQLSLKAKQTAPPKTPQPLKRTPTGLLGPSTTELSPLNIVQHCLSTLRSLAEDNTKVPSFFLTEHETSAMKARTPKKGKGKESKAAKYPLNALLALLDRKLLTDNTSVMQELASLLSQVTRPLTILLKRAKESQEPEQDKASETQGQEPAPAADVTMSDVPAEGAASASETAAQALDKEASVKQPEKRSKELTPPEVPEENIRLVVNILAARECPTRTFSDTLDVIKHLSAIPGAKEIFGKELVRKAQDLGLSVLEDLQELSKQINSAETSTDLQGLALANFSSAGSKQRMLLRVILALDHLFDHTRIPQSADTDNAVKDDVLAVLYNSDNFEKLWGNLSSCLEAIRARGNMVNVATILLPLIESLMVVCRNATLKEKPAPAATIVASPNDTKACTPTPESHMESLFFSFTEDNRKILNELIRNNPKLMSGNLSILARNSKVLEFDNKRTYFSRKVHNRGEARVAHPSLQLSVRRDSVFLDSFKSLYFKTAEEIKYGKLNIRFIGEEGIDAGGVSREWFAAMARQMFNPDYVLFLPVASDRTTFHPNPTSGINEEHLLFFKFIGRVIGKALYENRVLDCHFSRAVYRRILGKTVSLKDLESLDLKYYESLTWMLEHDITDIIIETFSAEIDRFGVTETVDLVPDGRNIPVTNENKHEYVQLIVEHLLIKAVEKQLEEFLKGFHEIIPKDLVSIFNEQELELLISGLPEIDVDDWKNNTEYHNYQATSPQIQWFWRAVRSFDKEERAKLLQFVTGTSKVPLNGFKELEGMNGFAKFNIHRDYSSKEKLPSSHTCFNQLDLPEYESYEHLRQQLYTAITAGSEYFGFA